MNLFDAPLIDDIDEGIADAVGIIETASIEEGPIETIFLLLSGGNDSMVLFDVCGEEADQIIHINTGVGIPETNQFVRDVVAKAGRDLIELHPPKSYDEIVLDGKLFGGFPGPAAHHFAYTRLKERPLDAMLRERRTRRGERFMFLTGIRQDESRRRMGYTNPVDRRGGKVWVNPLTRWSNDLMRRYRIERNLPVNPVTEHLHMSGECLCGAFAKPGELDEIGFFYPEFAERIRRLEAEAKASGLPACKWGERPPKPNQAAPGPMCNQCVLWVDEEAA